MSRSNRDIYLERFRNATAFIDSNLGRPLSVDEVSEAAHFSKFHFHRQFSAFFGLGVYEYIQLRRLKRASYELAFRTEKRVVDVALGNGYEGPEAFARAFKKRLGQTPTEFRKGPDWTAWHVAYQALTVPRRHFMNSETIERPIDIVDFPETRIAVLEHSGDPGTIGDSVRKFIDWRKQHGLSPALSATYNIFYDNPDETPPGDHRMDICASIKENVTPNRHGVIEKCIPAGRCARLRHTGSDEALGLSIHYLYSEWLPGSGETPGDFPVFVQRVRFFPDVPENEAITDIFLPLK